MDTVWRNGVDRIATRLHHVSMRKSLTPHEIREVAVRAMVDPRSVQKHLAGETVRSITAHRIRVALVQLGHEPIAGAAT